MRMINRMIEPTSGTLTVDGDDVTKVDPVKLRLGIGYVIQSAGLMPHQRVVDNVATVPVLRGESRRTARKAALGVMERVGLDPKLANRYPAQLSGGQQQRVGVARALAADPPILLMDEPFSAVDPVVREELQTEILRLQSELRKTIVFVTHDIDEALKLGDKVAVFGRGGVLQQYDEPSRLLSNPANDFVAGFIGADRGYRGLQFRHATGLPLHDIRTVAETEIDALTLGPDDWALVTQGRRHAVRAGSTPKVCELHRKGSSLYDSTVRRRIALPARRHAAPGAGRGAVVPVGAGRGGRRRRPADRRGAGRRRAGGAERATAKPAEARPGPAAERALSVHPPRRRLGADADPPAAVADPDRAGPADRRAAGRAGAAHHRACGG